MSSQVLMEPEVPYAHLDEGLARGLRHQCVEELAIGRECICESIERLRRLVHRTSSGLHQCVSVHWRECYEPVRMRR